MMTASIPIAKDYARFEGRKATMQAIDEAKEHCRCGGEAPNKPTAYFRLGFVTTSIFLCGVFMGCDSRDRRVLSHKVASLNADVSMISQQVEYGVRKVNDNSAKMIKFDDRLSLVEMALRRLDGENETMQTRTDRVALALRQIDEIKSRLEELEKANEFIVGRLERLEKGSANHPALPEVSAEQYAKLVNAHNSLFSEVEKLSKDVKELDDNISSPIGDVSFSPLSWIVELKRRVDNLEYDVRSLKFNSTSF